jgi:uncharacterized protein (TIGR02646 family)
MIFIHIGTYTPLERWLERSRNLSERLARLQNGAAELTPEAKELIDGNGIWTELKAELEILSFGKCWYSEAREKVSHYHVDHFRPKKQCVEANGSITCGYWWLAYDWRNYRVSGSVINTSKHDKFDVLRNRAEGPDTPLEDELIYLLDPLKRDDVCLLTFNNNGEAMPLNPDEETWDYKRAKYTIDVLDLNNAKLRRARKIRWKKISETIDAINAHSKQNNKQPSINLQTKINELKDQARELISPMSELSSTYRACLKASREDWAIDILQTHFNIERLQQEYRESMA